MTQPVPNVTRADVERVVKRDFPADSVAHVSAILDRYGIERWEESADRVHLAALKLAAGDIAALERHVAVAKRDPRDVIAAAEYPQAIRKFGNLNRMKEPDRASMFDADSNQYLEWLRR